MRDRFQDRLSDDELIELFEFKKHPIMQCYEYLGTTGAEWNYSVGAPLNNVSTYSNLIPPNAGLGITLGWNYLDAVYAIGVGTMQLLDEEDYRQTQNKAKGLLNIISGVQLFLLSYNPYLTAFLGLTGGAALAAPSFALAMGCDLVTASIDFYNANREVQFTGWLEERAKELDYHEKRILKLNAKIKEIKSPDNLSYEKRKTEIAYLETKKEKLQTKMETLQSDMIVRSRYYCQTGTDSSEARLKTVTSIINKYTPMNDENLSKRREQTLRTQLLSTRLTSADKKRNKDLQKQLEKSRKEQGVNVAFKAASFVGMTLIAAALFCPPLLLPGFVITTTVATFYIYRNSDKILKQMKEFSLFKPQEKYYPIYDDLIDGYAYPSTKMPI